MHDAGDVDIGEHNLIKLADLVLQRVAELARTEPDSASAVSLQLLPQLAR